MARRSAPEDIPTDAPGIEDIVSWLVEEGRAIATIRTDLQARGLSPQVAGQLIARALRQIERDDVPTPPALERARLRHLASRALLEGDSRAYRSLTGDLRAVTPVQVEPPATPDPDALKQCVLRVMAQQLAGQITSEQARGFLSSVATLTQIDYAAAAAARGATPEELEERPTTHDELARWTVAKGQT